MSALRTSYSHLTLWELPGCCVEHYTEFLGSRIKYVSVMKSFILWPGTAKTSILSLSLGHHQCDKISLVLHIYDIHLAVPLHTSFSNHDHFLKSNRHGFKKLQMFKVVFFGSLYLWGSYFAWWLCPKLCMIFCLGLIPKSWSFHLCVYRSVNMVGLHHWCRDRRQGVICQHRWTWRNGWGAGV